MSGFFSLPNLQSHRAKSMKHPPWDSWTKYKIPEAVNSKPKYKQWIASTTTKHAFFSMVEGMDPRSRVKKDNQPLYVHGLVVDYDFPDALARVNIDDKGKTPSELLPAYGSKTFSGNARAVWLFEEKIMVANKKHADAFLKKLADLCHCDEWFPGYEEQSAIDSAHYYEIGHEWENLYPEYRISRESLHLMAYEASQGITLANGPDTQYSVPISAVAEAVEKEFPGRWPGNFDLGARGPRFWDPDADNPTAAVVTEQGMLCYTGGQPFVPWTQIFGREFVRQFEGNMIAEIRGKTFYDGAAFWMFRENGSKDTGNWIRKAKDDFSQYLRVAGFNSSRRRGAASEIDRIENDIKTYNLVDGAFPFIHHKQGLIVHAGRPFLNISDARALEPAPPGYIETFDDGKQHFPFLFDYLNHFFENHSSDEMHSQLEYFLAWLWHFYTNAYHFNPKPGQAIFLAGPTGKGKTLMARGIIGKLVGGYADAASYLVDGSQWTDDLVSSPILAVEDSTAQTEEGKRTRYSALIKKITANFSLPYNGKYKGQNNTLPWLGRVIVTCNVDPESLRILPSLEISNRDKVSLFKTAGENIQLPDMYELETILANELPMFARWLLDWEPPASLMNSKNPRFGTLPYHHTELQWESSSSGTTPIIFELLNEFLETWFTVNTDSDEYVGTATNLYKDISGHNDLMKKYSVQQLGLALGNFVAQGWNIEKPKAKSKGLRIWRIPKDLRMGGGN